MSNEEQSISLVKTVYFFGKNRAKQSISLVKMARKPLKRKGNLSFKDILSISKGSHPLFRFG